MNTDLPDPIYVAYHEAGHAVMGRIHGFNVLEISIERASDGSEGRVHWAELAGLKDKLVAISPMQAKHWILMYAAGQAAQGRRHILEMEDDIDRAVGDHWRHLPDATAQSDREHAWGLASDLLVHAGHDPEDLKYQLVNEWWEEARVTMKEPAPWRAVEVLAQALIKERTIAGSRAQMLIDQALNYRVPDGEEPIG